jgi:hypothetical protein
VKRILLIIICMLIMPLVPACNLFWHESPPAEPITVHLSFPDGAPPLNQEAELVCTVKTPAMSAKNLSLSINLPEALELVSGDLSWSGDIAQGVKVEVIKAVVRSTKTGNWTIEATTYIDPEKHGGYGGTGRYFIYVSVFENSAKWGIYPPWYKHGFSC